MDEYEDYEDYVIDADDYETYDDIDDEDYGEEDEMDAADEMLDAMVEGLDDADPEELADFFWRRKKRRRRKARKVPTARGRNAFRRAAKGRYVTQAQLKSALGRVGRDVRRNAVGIKQVNGRINGVSNRVTANSRVNRIQGSQIGKLQKLHKAEGVLEFVQAYNPETGGLDAFQLLKGAVSSGLLGTGKGGMHNPYVLGGIGLLLRNPNALGGLLGQNPAT